MSRPFYGYLAAALLALGGAIQLLFYLLYQAAGDLVLAVLSGVLAWWIWRAARRAQARIEASTQAEAEAESGQDAPAEDEARDRTAAGRKG